MSEVNEPTVPLLSTVTAVLPGLQAALPQKSSLRFVGGVPVGDDREAVGADRDGTGRADVPNAVDRGVVPEEQSTVPQWSTLRSCC